MADRVGTGTGADNYTGNGTSQLEIEDVMINGQAYPSLSTISGAAAGASYGTDNLVYPSPAWGDGKGAITSCFIPGWQPASQGPSGNPYVWSHAGNDPRHTYDHTSGNMEFFSGTLSEPGAWDEIVPTVTMCEFDGVNRTLTVDDGTITASSDSSVFAGAHQIGANVGATANIGNGGYCQHYWPNGLPAGVTFDDVRNAYLQAAANCISGTTGLHYITDENGLVYVDGSPVTVI